MRLHCPLSHLRRNHQYLDSHCHLDHLLDQYGVSVDSVCGPPNFYGCIANFVFPRHYNLIDKISMPVNVWPTVGLHPSYASSLNARVRSFLQERCSASDVVAVGETGLCSKAAKHTSYDIQDEAFDFQVKLASRLDKPVIIHSRGNSQPTLDCCSHYLHHSHKIHLHCFTGSVEDVHSWTQHFPNLKVGITGLLFDDESVQDLVKFLPLNKLLLETDAPHFPLPFVDVPFSFPQSAISIAQEISLIKKLYLRDVIAHTTTNAKFIYDII